MTCRLCLDACRFFILDSEGNKWLPGYCARHGADMLRPLTTPIPTTQEVELESTRSSDARPRPCFCGGRGRCPGCAPELRPNEASPDAGHPHLINGEFQSDKYPTCPRGKVPLSVKDPTAQDLLWEYAQRRRAVDTEFADDLEIALGTVGYKVDMQARAHVSSFGTSDGQREEKP